jgi:hypothetical protein
MNSHLDEACDKFLILSRGGKELKAQYFSSTEGISPSVLLNSDFEFCVRYIVTFTAQI